MSSNQQQSKPDSPSPIETHDKPESSMYTSNNIPISAVSDTGTKLYANLTAVVGPVISNIKENNTSNFTHAITTASEKTADDSFEVIQMPSRGSGITTQQIHLYLIRYSKANSKFLIQALFSPDIKRNFGQSKALQSGSEYLPCVHYLNMNVIPTNTNRFCCQHDGRSHVINDYSLRISLPNFSGTKHSLDSRKRCLSECPPTWHQFLFNVEFPDHDSMKVLGKFCTKIARGNEGIFADRFTYPILATTLLVYLLSY